MEPIENTTQQLHYPTGDQPTRAQMAVPTTVQTAAVPAAPPVPAPPAPAPRPPAPARATPGRGKTTISDEVVQRVIQKLVDLAVEKVDGVHGLRAGVDRFFGEAESQPESTEPERAVAVRLADGEATINIAVEVDFGYAVHRVVEEVRGFVISEAEQLLGLTVAEVNVAVSEVSFDVPAAPAEPEP